MFAIAVVVLDNYFNRGFFNPKGARHLNILRGPGGPKEVIICFFFYKILHTNSELSTVILY